MQIYFDKPLDSTSRVLNCMNGKVEVRLSIFLASIKRQIIAIILYSFKQKIMKRKLKQYELLQIEKWKQLGAAQVVVVAANVGSCQQQEYLNFWHHDQAKRIVMLYILIIKWVINNCKNKNSYNLFNFCILIYVWGFTTIAPDGVVIRDWIHLLLQDY
ncbi:unnamed protein product (macronuclear) [Paramecium tetraurelia]|uniref:Transmembrane protein n=1 Tax=Paramecium tetraurelia TaxID=5888 RepID=A0DP20_PARTE|nr:uncharacterized protein GSPATT00039695001 [Paramecium tetraurelia]CAK84787.1 unnamed protein product [Paramecium tetraurelia]|eukprot:XP_001452184.1 hypothetical protein (macronuclear) [Paramecium tetraurelia strain d4-2]